MHPLLQKYIYNYSTNELGILFKYYQSILKKSLIILQVNHESFSIDHSAVLPQLSNKKGYSVYKFENNDLSFDILFASANKNVDVQIKVRYKNMSIKCVHFIYICVKITPFYTKPGIQDKNLTLIDTLFLFSKKHQKETNCIVRWAMSK